MSNSLPFDLWIVVAAHLPVRDIVSLSHVRIVNGGDVL